METDLEYYTRSMVEALHAARRAPTPEVRRAQERLASAFALQIQRVEPTPTVVTPAELRLRPRPIEALAA